MDNVKVRLDVFKVCLADALQKNDSYLFACIEVVGTDDSDDFSCDGLVTIVDELFDKAEVDQDYFLLFAQIDFVGDVEFDETFDGLEEHAEARVGIGTSNGRPVDVYLEG